MVEVEKIADDTFMVFLNEEELAELRAILNSPDILPLKFFERVPVVRELVRAETSRKLSPKLNHDKTREKFLVKYGLGHRDKNGYPTFRD